VANGAGDLMMRTSLFEPFDTATFLDDGSCRKGLVSQSVGTLYGSIHPRYERLDRDLRYRRSEAKSWIQAQIGLVARQI
jgi:hypothetical protein